MSNVYLRLRSTAIPFETTKQWFGLSASVSAVGKAFAIANALPTALAEAPKTICSGPWAIIIP